MIFQLTREEIWIPGTKLTVLSQFLREVGIDVEVNPPTWVSMAKSDGSIRKLLQFIFYGIEPVGITVRRRKNTTVAKVYRDAKSLESRRPSYLIEITHCKISDTAPNGMVVSRLEVGTSEDAARSDEFGLQLRDHLEGSNPERTFFLFHHLGLWLTKNDLGRFINGTCGQFLVMLDDPERKSPLMDSYRKFRELTHNLLYWQYLKKLETSVSHIGDMVLSAVVTARKNAADSKELGEFLSAIIELRKRLGPVEEEARAALGDSLLDDLPIDQL